MTKILKAEEFINEQVVNEMGMRVRNANIQQRMTDQLKMYNLVYNKTNGLYDCDGDVEVKQDLISPDGKFVIKFGVVKGDFDCSNINLTSLEGAPQEVGKSFYCNVNKLTSLKGSPKKVGGSFYCEENQLTTLEGAPQVVGGSFYCNVNKLTTLEGAPQEVGKSFYCDENELTTLEGAPQEVGGNFYCYGNRLTSLAGAPQKVGKDFDCHANKLIFDETNFYGLLPDVIGGKLKADKDCDYELATDYYNKR